MLVILLFSIFILALGAGASLNLAGRLSMSAVFLLAGVTHFTAADKFIEMLPVGWYHADRLIYLTGVLEIFGGIGLLLPRFAPITGNFLIAFLICVLPANIYASYAQVEFGGGELGLWYLLYRVPLQLLMMSWVYLATGQTWFRLWGDVLFPMGYDYFMASGKEEYRKAVTADLKGRVLEIGFGTGLNLPFYPEQVTKLITVDPNPGMNAQAKKRIEASSITVDARSGSAEKLPLEDNSIDCALTSWVLCSIPSPEKAVAEIRRVLKPGGTFYFIEHGISPDPDINKWQKRLNPIQANIADGCRLDLDVKDLLKNSGLNVGEIKEFIIPDDPGTHSYTYQGSAQKPA